MRDKSDAELGTVVSRSPGEGTFTVGALPVLLQRKKDILDWMRILAPQEQLADAQEVVAEKVSDPEVREQLNALLESFADKQRTLAEES
ncbi:hypothetical protein [Dactylosporangium sp. CA-092794]|uniref:hypothetical protein n=1 Tax=Dactylosporangium sp. CA-092794 TaxID=3239929 RepID=UPI003D90D7FB